MTWGRIPQPYVGGDPVNYVAFAREMTSFYQPHVREPVFLATTRLALAVVDDQDAAVSLASASGSVLTIFATYLLGAAVVSPPAGLIAAALYAIEYESITWAVDGWRDDTFGAFFVLTAWALVRFREQASLGRALIRDPGLVQRLQSGELTASRCVPCNQCVVEMERGGTRCVRRPPPAQGIGEA